LQLYFTLNTDRHTAVLVHYRDCIRQSQDPATSTAMKARKKVIKMFRSWGSSVSIVFDYGLDDRAIEVRSSAETSYFFSLDSVQTGSGAHPASCPMGTGSPFPGAKARPGRDADRSSVEVKNE
jgi:hypothetical protein